MLVAIYRCHSVAHDDLLALTDGEVMAGNIRTPGESVSGRLLRVLDCFDPGHTELSLTQIVQRSGLPTSTARRLIAELVAWGGLERLVDNRYRIGLQLWRVGILAPQQRGLREAALPLMHDLCRATKQTVQLVVLDGDEALCVEKVTTQGAVANITEVGGRLPLHATAVGKCLLALTPRELFESLAARGFDRITRHTIVQPGLLLNMLKQTRKAGVAYSREEMTIGAASAAAAIVGPGGILVGALGVIVKSNSNVEHLASAVLTAAHAIARTSGRDPSSPMATEWPGMLDSATISSRVEAPR
jgi:DNA-binding IclR family transcriptional regulator